MRHLPTYCVIVSLAAAAPTTAGVVIDHPGILSGGPASDTEFVIIPGPPIPTWQLLADNFVWPDVGEPVRRITFFGFYGSTFAPIEPPPDTETFRVRFYDVAPGSGLPGTIVFEESVVDPSRTATGNTILNGPGPPEFVYQIDLTTPLALAPNTPYWLEVVQLGNLDSHFRWEFAFTDQDSFAFFNENVPDWTFSSLGADLAFQLSTVPEPGTIVIFLLGYLLVRSRGKA